MKLFKFTDRDGYSFRLTHWFKGKTHEAKRWADSPVLCTASVIHAYESLEMGLMMDDVHAGYFPDGKIWEAEGDVIISSGFKVGVKSLTTVKEIKLDEGSQFRLRYGKKSRLSEKLLESLNKELALKHPRHNYCGQLGIMESRIYNRSNSYFGVYSGFDTSSPQRLLNEILSKHPELRIIY